VSVFNYFVVGVMVIKYFYAHCSLHDLLVFLLCDTASNPILYLHSSDFVL
jgi:hypothetical protein